MNLFLSVCLISVIWLLIFLFLFFILSRKKMILELDSLEQKITEVRKNYSKEYADIFHTLAGLFSKIKLFSNVRLNSSSNVLNELKLSFIELFKSLSSMTQFLLVSKFSKKFLKLFFRKS